MHTLTVIFLLFNSTQSPEIFHFFSARTPSQLLLRGYFYFDPGEPFLVFLIYSVEAVERLVVDIVKNNVNSFPAWVKMLCDDMGVKVHCRIELLNSHTSYDGIVSLDLAETFCAAHLLFTACEDFELATAISLYISPVGVVVLLCYLLGLVDRRTYFSLSVLTFFFACFAGKSPINRIITSNLIAA